MTFRTFVRHSDRFHNVPYLNCRDDRPYVNWYNLDNRWNDNEPAGLRKPFYFSPRSLRGWVLLSCPLQPPSIFPISSSRSESAIYCLVVMDLVSHKIMHNSFNVSFFLIASRTYGSLVSRVRNVAAETASIISINSVSTLVPSEYRWVLGKLACSLCHSK